MDISEIVNRINNGEKVGDVAKSLNMAQSTLSRKLKVEGYRYNNKTKVYELRDKNSENNDSQVVKINEKSTNQELTEDEIKFVKDSYKNRTFFDEEFELNYEKNNLPPRKPEKKTNYIVSAKTYDEFEKFAEKVGEPKRMTRNDLVEMALRKFMKDFQ